MAEIKKIIIIILAISLMIIPQMGCQSNIQSSNAGIYKTGFYLDTICTITIYGVDKEKSEITGATDEERNEKINALIDQSFDLCKKYEKQLSSTISTSDVSRINQSNGQPVKVDKETIEVIKKGIYYGRLSQGAFDITIGKVTDLWDFTGNQLLSNDRDKNTVPELPDEETLKEALSHVDFNNISVNDDTVSLTDKDAKLELGGIAKGYIADRVAEFLEQKGVIGAVVDLGGNIVTIGGKSQDIYAEKTDDFSIGIRNPMRDDGSLLGVLKCRDKTIVTSGTYERYFEKDGVKYHHILDTKTGYPVENHIISVSVITDKGKSVDGDGLSTCCLSLGLEKGMELIKSIDGAEAIFVDEKGKVTMSNEDMDFTLE